MQPTLIDFVAVVVLLVLGAAVAYAIGSPHFYGSWGHDQGSNDFTGVAFRSRYAPGTYGAQIERQHRSDRFHRIWSYVGALALAGLSVLCLLGPARPSGSR